MGDIEQEVGSREMEDGIIGNKVAGFVSHVRSGFRSIGLRVSDYFETAMILLRSLISLFVAVGGCILLPLVLIIIVSLKKKWLNLGVKDEEVAFPSWSMAGIYAQSKRKESLFHRLMLGSLRLIAQSGLLLLLWLVVNVSVPRLNALKLLGSPLWRWSLLAVVLTCSYFVVMSIYLIPGAFRTMFYKLMHIGIGTQYRRPYFDLSSRLFPSATLAMYSGMVLVLWLFYFRTDAGLNHASTPHPQAFGHVTWTCVSLFVGSILMLLKTLLLLKWSDNAIYGRFQPKILITRAKFFYIDFFVGGFCDDRILRELRFIWLTPDVRSTSFNYTNYIMSQKVSTHYLQDAGRLLSSLAKIVTPLEEDGVPKLLESLEYHEFFRTDHNDRCMDSQPPSPISGEQNEVTYEWIRMHGPGLCNIFLQSLGSDKSGGQFWKDYAIETAYILISLVREQAASEYKQLTSDDFKKWLVDAHKNCVNMGRTLIDANAIVTRLDIFLSFIIFIIVVLLWLLITGIATTTVLVTIATPLLALTFIFGDSAKQFFQGIIFCFGTHAFDVGDRCIIDDTEFEVKSMDILTTTFTKVGTAEKSFFPNSVLATKAIVNLGWQPDPSDIVELTLDYTTTRTQWQMLEKKVEQFFNDLKQKEFFQSWHEVMMKESGDKIKVAIRFKHVLNVNEMTHGECLQKKNRQRSKILKEVNYFLDHTSPTTTITNEITNEIEQVITFSPGYLRSKSDDRHNRKMQNARQSGHWSC